MTWVQKLLASVLVQFLTDLAVRVGQSFSDWLARRKAIKKVEMDAEALRIQTEAAMTPEERERAARDTIRRHF